ncbi:ankyrin repeat domain-containing protein [Hyunsoonleella ulvae]|uniref:ankyrin repeat domain-containing protein n=1 Tax=Hyunsoonleella ulvae TaxID=2799948 RepID=UPI00193A658B|nr:ankyrin repeat domain-containing protein [Hyunsoonleella ulvae]
MKKSIIISAFALCFSIISVNATTSFTPTKVYSSVAISEVSPFCVSIAKGDLETVKKLIELGANVNEKSNGMTPAMYAAKFNRCDILKLLIAKGAKLKVKSTKGMTAMKYAKLHKAVDAEKVLKEALAKKKK